MSNTYPPVPTVTEEPNGPQTVAEVKRESLKEPLFAWLSLLMGYLFCRAFPANEYPFGAFLFVVLLYGVTVILLNRRGVFLRGFPLVAALSALAISFSLVWCANPTIHAVSYLYALLVYFYMVYAMTGNRLREGFSNLLPADFFKALILLPLSSLGNLFGALSSGKKGRGRLLLSILLGTAIAVIPTAIIVDQLSYDARFIALMDRVWNFLDVDDIFSHFASLLLALPLGMYLYGAYHAAINRKCAEVMTADDCATVWRKAKVLPPLSATVALLPILCLYGVFFVSQWDYYVACFAGELPSQTIYSEYARDGFFQLCRVSVFNLLILSLTAFFTARRGEEPSVSQRILSVLLSLETLVLISTAIAKMVMYINYYGLTPKRVYATWLMIVLAIVFLLIILQQCIRRIKLVPAGIAVCVGLFVVLNVINADAVIARYNVDRYLAGTLREVDIDVMEDLGDDAVPEVVRLVEELDARQGSDITAFPYVVFQKVDLSTMDITLYDRAAIFLYERADRPDEHLFSLTVPHIRAQTALKECGILAAVQKVE